MEVVRSCAAPIDACLNAFARRQRQVAVVRIAAESFLIFCATLTVVALLETLVRPGHSFRVALSSLVYLAGITTLAWRGFRPLWRRPSRFEIARSLENAAQGRLRERLMSAVELSETHEPRPGISAWMVNQTISLAENEAAALDPVALVDPTPARRCAKWAILAGTMLAILTFTPGTGPLLRLALNPYAPAIALAKTRLDVSPGDARIRQGETIDIRATARPLPDHSTLEVQWEDGFKERLSMSPIADTNAFATRLPALSQSFRYRVLAGDAESRSYRVHLEAPPRLDRVRLEITPPAHTGWPTRLVPGGDAEALTGSRIRLLAELAGEPASQAWLRADNTPDRLLHLRSSLAELEFTADQSFTYGFKLEGVNGQTIEPTQRWSLRVLPDQPPTASLSGPGLDTGVVGLDELLLLKSEARDDVGLKSLSLVSVLNGTNTLSLPLTLPPSPNPPRETLVPVTLDILSRHASQGDELQVRLEATDLAGQIGIGGPFNLLVSNPDLARVAQLAARLRTQLLRLDLNLDLLRESRTSWSSLARSRDVEPEELRRDLRLLTSRLDQLRSDLTDTGNAIEKDAASATLPISQTVNILGANLRAWSQAQYRVLHEVALQAGTGSETQRADAFTRGRDLFDQALQDAGMIRRHLALATLALDTEVLASRSESAQGRYRRALPIVRVAHGLEASVRSGLQADFFAGLTKSLVFSTNDIPHLDNFDVPSHGQNAWSVRYSGELYIPETGPWTLATLADDGVRLQLDGRPVTPEEAWREHPTTEYRTNLTLTAGWHPILLEKYQAGGDSKLRLLLGRQGRTLNEAPRVQLRSPANELRDIERQVAALPPEARQQADRRAVTSLGTVAPVPDTLAALTNDLPLEGLVRLARDSQPAGAYVRTNFSRLPDWTLAISYDLEQKGDVLVNAARDARNLLRGEMDQLRWKVRGPADLRPLRVPMETLRESADSLRRIASADKSRAGKRAAQEREAAQASAWARELTRATQQLDNRLFDRAREDGHHLSERALDLIASARVEREAGEAARKIEAALSSAKSSPEDMAGQVQQHLERIERALADPQRAVESGLQGASATLAAQAQRESRSLAETKNDSPRQAKAYESLRTTVDQLAQAESTRGNQPAADALDRALSNAPQNANLNELNNQLRNLRNALPNIPESVASLPAPALRDQARNLGRNPQAQSDAAQALARPRVALAVEAERSRRAGDRPLGNAYQRLGRDLGQLIQQPATLTQPAVEQLADRADALAGTRGQEARQREIAAANRNQPPTNPPPGSDPSAEQYAQQLERLSLDAHAAADQPARRPPLMTGLDSLASEADAASPPPGSESEPASESPDPNAPPARSLAAGAATQAGDQIRSAPKEWNAYREASQTLSDAAERLRVAQAGAETTAARPPGEEPGEETPGDQPGQETAGNQTKPGQTTSRQGQSTDRPVGDAQGVASTSQGEDQAAWARLAARLRQSVRTTGIEHFSEEHQEAIRAYYKRLGQDR